MTNVRHAIARAARIVPLACAFAFAFAPAAGAQVAGPGALPRPKPASVTTSGTLRVERYGSGSPAMIFIPGLTCGSWVWDGAVRRYAATHAVYVVTLAGFDGLPAPATPGIDGADASLATLIANEKLDRPILVGHSLGGFLALRFATEHAALLRGAVSVDGTPVFPTLASASAAERATTGDAIAAQTSGATPDQFAAVVTQSTTAMVTDQTVAAAVAKREATSDPKATGAYLGDLFRADLRPDLAKMTVPVLEIAPVPAQPAAYEGPAAATMSLADRAAHYKAFYASLFPNAPNVTVVTIPNSRHFVMIDQPQALFDAIAAFVATLPK